MLDMVEVCLGAIKCHPNAKGLLKTDTTALMMGCQTHQQCKRSAERGVHYFHCADKRCPVSGYSYD